MTGFHVVRDGWTVAVYSNRQRANLRIDRMVRAGVDIAELQIIEVIQ